MYILEGALMPPFMKLSFIMQWFLCLGNKEIKNSQREIKDTKIRAGAEKKLSHNVVVFTVLHQAEKGLLNTERAG